MYGNLGDLSIHTTIIMCGASMAVVKGITLTRSAIIERNGLCKEVHIVLIVQSQFVSVSLNDINIMIG